ncbi:hypothetical protein [Nocardia sp. CC227C]|uniref:TRADD-N-associated membrane domain-containing protein n=1 Tax=Nocardia sp. CC227C TaxID=3044562 RepID=UPI00278C3F74|nr:hypothetical protein [Nocardia sp. CC227C]
MGYRAELERLEKKRDDLRDKLIQLEARSARDEALALIKQTKRSRRVAVAIAVVGVSVAAAVSWATSWHLGPWFAAGIGLVGVYNWLRAGELIDRGELVVARAEVHAALGDIHGPNDLLGLMKLNRRQMDAYDVSARRQGSASHWASIAAMAVGLGVIGVGLWIAVTAEQDAAKYAAALIAAAGIATGGYIAQTFIRVHSTTQEQVRFYFEQPLVQSYMLMAERFIAQMPESERPAQFAKLVDSAVAQAAMVPQHRIGVQPIQEPPAATPPEATAEPAS